MRVANGSFWQARRSEFRHVIATLPLVNFPHVGILAKRSCNYLTLRRHYGQSFCIILLDVSSHFREHLTHKTEFECTPMRMEINRLARCASNANSNGLRGGSFRPIVYKQCLNSFQLKQKHHQVHPRSHPKLKHSKVHRKPTLKPPASYLVPNPKFHYSTEKSSANNSATISVDLENHQSQSSTLNPVYEYSEEINAQAERDFNERRRHLWEVCERSKIVGKFSPNAWEFLISPGHGLAWCNVFKAASSTWMYYFNLLGKT